MNTRERKHQTCRLSEGRQDEELRKKEHKGNMLTKCQIRFGGAYSTSMVAVNMVDLFFETPFVMVLQDALPTADQTGPVRSAMANDGLTKQASIDPQKQVEERERVAENQRPYPRDSWATDVLRDVGSGVVGVRVGRAEIEQRALGGANPA